MLDRNLCNRRQTETYTFRLPTLSSTWLHQCTDNGYPSLNTIPKTWQGVRYFIIGTASPRLESRQWHNSSLSTLCLTHFLLPLATGTWLPWVPLGRGSGPWDRQQAVASSFIPAGSKVCSYSAVLWGHSEIGEGGAEGNLFYHSRRGCYGHLAG